MSNILEICQEVAEQVNTQKPKDLFNANSQQEKMFWSIIKDTLECLRRYGDWSFLIKDGVVETKPNKQVYYIPDYCDDFYTMCNTQIFITDSKGKEVEDCIHKLQNNCFRLFKNTDKKYTFEFKYRSANIVENKSFISSNEDVPVFEKELIKLGMLWRWYKRNGIPYEEEFNEYKRELKARFNNDSEN